MDAKVSASGPATSSTLSQIAQTYKDAIEESVGKTTKMTVNETYSYVGDVMKMAKHVADDKSADKNIMTDFMRDVTSAYDEALKQMKANRIASTLNAKSAESPPLNTDRKSGVRTSMKAYGTSRVAKEPKAKRSKSAGGF